MHSISRNHANLISIFTLIIGIGFLLTASILTVSTSRFITMASRAEGTVVRITVRNLEPVIRFVPAGSTAAVEFVGTGVINRYDVGDKVPVLYLSDAEYLSGFHTNIDTIDALWSPQLFYAVLGTSAIFNGLHVKRWASRQSIER